LADLLVDRGQTAEADALAAEVENLSAGSPEILRAAAFYHLRRENAKAAESVLRKALGATAQGSPERLALLGDLAALYLMRGDAEEAKEVLGEIRRLQPGDPAAARQLAALHLIEGNLPAAQGLISETLSKDPNDREARVLRARIDLAEGRYVIAAETLRRVVEEEPKSVDGNLYLAKAVAAQAQWQEARTLFLLVLDRVPEHFGASLDLARTYLGMGRPLDALESVDRALKIRAGDPEARWVKARALLEAGRGSEAEAEYRALAAAKDGGAAALTGLGRTLELQGRRDEALQAYREARRRAPGLVDAVIWEMDLLDRMGRHDEVERVGLALLERSGEAPPVLNALAVHALGRRQPDRAKGYLARSLAAAPDAVPTLEIQARVLLAEGDAEGAAQVLEKALRTHPDRVSALLLRIIALERLGRAEEVRATYKRILGVDPDNALAANNLASLYLRDGTDLSEALRLAQLAVDRAPGSGAAKDTLGWAYYKTGHYEQAARVLEEAHRLLPDAPEVVYHLGMASAKLGQDKKAQELLARALAAEKKGDWAFEAGQVLQELQAKKP
jgi:tetratricopeptide (TPR) repeat protein